MVYFVTYSIYHTNLGHVEIFKKKQQQKTHRFEPLLHIPGTTGQEGRTNIGFGRWSQVKHLNSSKRFGGFLWVTGKVDCFWQRGGGGI